MKQTLRIMLDPIDAMNRSITRESIDLESIEVNLTDVGVRNVKVEILGRTVTVSRADLFLLWRSRTDHLEWWVNASFECMRAAHDRFVKIVQAGSSAHIPVKRAGRGPTDKSVKVIVAGVLHEDPLDSRESAIFHSHTLTVPASLVIECKGQLYAPRWLIERTVHDRILSGKRWPQGVRGGSWLDADEFWRELWEPIAAKAQRIVDAAAAEQERQNKLWKEKNDTKKIDDLRLAEERQRQVDREAEMAAQDAVKRAKRMAALETLRVTSVEYDKWIKEKNRFGTTWVKVTYIEEDCVLKFSGQRVYIITDDGDEIIKARKNVRWTVAP